MLTNDQKATLISLQEYLSRIAHHIIRAHWPQADPEDVLAQMNLFIAEKTEEDPAFLQQSPGFVTKAAAWEARHWLRDTYTRYMHGQRISASVALEMDDEDSRPADEMYASAAPDPDIAIAVRAALVGLDEISRKVAELKMAGLKRTEIAEALGTSSQSLGQYLKRIENALSPVWAAVQGRPEPTRQLSFGL